MQVDSIITDIPYGTTSCSWDVVIPFDEMWDRINNRINTYTNDNNMQDVEFNISE